MKYQVQIKFTNPSHEHVSLRRRVDTITRIVEASSEDEAINRGANQQRALGFKIQEALILKPLNEGFDPEPSDIAAQLVKKHGKGKVTKDHVDAYEKDRDSNKAIDKEAVMKHVQRMSEEVVLDEMDKSQPSSSRGAEGLALGKKVNPVKTDKVKSDALKLLQKQYKKVKEEVEQVDEANMRFDPEAAARPKSSDVKNFLNRDKNPRAAAASKKYIRRMTKLGGLGPNQTKKDTEAHMKAHFEEVELSEASKEGKDVMRNMRASLKSMDLRHGVDSDKREAGYKMSPAVKAAQAKSDMLSKKVKRPQAGTIAAVHKSMEREMLKKEAADPGSMKVVNKKVKAAEKMINAAKGKVNKVNMKPSIELEKYKE